MSEILFFYWFTFMSAAIFATDVRLLGIFPHGQDNFNGYVMSDLTVHWTTQSSFMFETAMKLAEKYKLYAHGKPIQYTVHRTMVGPNGFAEFDFVCNAITNKSEPNTVGIVGPASSTSARFLAMLAAHLNMPLVSHAATNADLAESHIYETFYRMAPSDALLAKAIVGLFEKFAWQTCILIYGKDDYGYGGLKILSEEYFSNISIKDRIVFDPQLDQFNFDLNRTLERSRSRVVLVWANQSASARIIRHALNLELFHGTFIWILTSQIDLKGFPEKDQPSLQGLLAVIPTISNESRLGVNETLQMEALNVWHELVKGNTTQSKDLSSISPFAMYTFDATWTLIQALHQISINASLPSMTDSVRCFGSRLENYTAYMTNLKNTNFSGITGAIQFNKSHSNNRLNGTLYTLYNVNWIPPANSSTKGKSFYKQPMYWCQTTNQWKNISRENNMNSIVWPGPNQGHIPTDYRQLRGQPLDIVVIEAPPFVMIRNRPSKMSITHVSERATCYSDELPTATPGVYIYGFVADVLRELKTRMQFNSTIHVADPRTDYHSLVFSLAGENPKYHMAVSDIRITSNRLETVDFSTPIHENNFQIVMRQTPYSPLSNLFSCFNPFTWDVWVAILAVILYTGMIIYFFEHQNIENHATDSRLKRILTGIFRIIVTVVMMTGDVRLSTNASRLTVLALYAFGVILIAIYTANLSSILTLKRSQSTITGIDDIKNGHIPFTRIGIIANSAVSDYYIQNISSTFQPLSSVHEMYEQLLDETIDASIWDSSVLEYVVNDQYCGRLMTVGVGFVRSSYAIALRKDWPYKRDLDKHILNMRESETLECLEHRWFSAKKCASSSSNSDKDGISDSDTFSLEVLSGLFVSFLIITAIAVGIHLWYWRKPITNFFRPTTKQQSRET